MKYAFLAIAAFALVVYSGCIFSPDEEPPPPKPDPTYKSLTEKENIIYNLVQSYKAHQINPFEELLHPDYIWYNQEGVTPEYLDRTTDILQTGRLFAAANNSSTIPADKWLEALDLKIEAGYWEQIQDVEGVACADCWKTTRTYSILARLNGGATTWVGDDLIEFIAMGVDQGGKRIYLLRRAQDIKKSS
jgi:hypothetical protein